LTPALSKNKSKTPFAEEEILEIDIDKIGENSGVSRRDLMGSFNSSRNASPSEIGKIQRLQSAGENKASP
jgi:hypothetical protein